MKVAGKPMRSADYGRKAFAMKAFLKSDLFLRFLGGFAIGAVGMVMLQPDEPPMFSSTAVAATSTDGSAL